MRHLKIRFVFVYLKKKEIWFEYTARLGKVVHSSHIFQNASWTLEPQHMRTPLHGHDSSPSSLFVGKRGEFLGPQCEAR